MGKNKNKGFDLAKRQEKILKRLAKPLYKRADDSVYLVISQPFGMKPSPAERGTMDIGRLASWISWVFRKQSVVDIVYTMSTKDEVIVKISEGVDRDRILGKHRYNDIVSTGWPQDRSFASCVFEYNYQDNGDPAEHNWREYVPSDASAPPGLFRDPCPAPTWIARPPYLANLAHHLPESLPRTPKRSPEPFYQASSHARGENVKQEQNYSLRYPDATAPSSDFVPGPVKVEPYGRTSVQSQQTATATYEPTQALRDEIARLNAGRSQATIGVKHEPVPHQIKFESSDAASVSSPHDAPRISMVSRSNTQSLDVKQEPRDVLPVASDAGPSQELWNEWSRYQSRWKRPGDPSTGSSSLSDPSIASGEQGPYILPTMARSATIAGSSETPESFNSNPRGPFKVKREQTVDEDEQPWKRPKTELN